MIFARSNAVATARSKIQSTMSTMAKENTVLIYKKNPVANVRVYGTKSTLTLGAHLQLITIYATQFVAAIISETMPAV